MQRPCLKARQPPGDAASLATTLPHHRTSDQCSSGGVGSARQGYRRDADSQSAETVQCPAIPDQDGHRYAGDTER